MHVLNDSALAIVLELVLNALLTNKAFPVELALAHRIYLTTAVIDCAHHVVKVLIGYMGLATLKFLGVIFSLWLLEQFEALLLFNDLELSSFLIEHEFFTCEHDPLARLHGFTVENVYRQLD